MQNNVIDRIRNRFQQPDEAEIQAQQEPTAVTQERRESDIANSIAPLAEELSQHATLFLTSAYSAAPEALLAGKTISKDAQIDFADSKAVGSIIANHPKAIAQLHELEERALLPGSNLRPEDFYVRQLSVDLLLKARRKIIVQTVAEDVHNGLAFFLSDKHQAVIKQVAEDLAKPSTSPITQLIKQEEKDTYCGELLRRTVDGAIHLGVKSKEFNSFGIMYQTMTAGSETNVTRRAVAAGLDTVQNIVKKRKPEIPGHGLDKAIDDLMDGYDSGAVPKTGTDRILYKSFGRVIRNTYLDLVKQIDTIDTTRSPDKKNSLEAKAELLKDLGETVRWQIVEVTPDEVAKQQAATARKQSRRTAGSVRKPVGEIEPSDDDEPYGGTIQIVRAAAITAIAATGVSMPAAAVAAGNVTPPTHQVSTYSVYLHDQSQGDQMPQYSNIEEGDNSGQSAIIPEVAPQQAASDTAPATPDPSTPDTPNPSTPDAPNPSTPNAPDPNAPAAPNTDPTTTTPDQPQTDTPPAASTDTTPAPVESGTLDLSAVHQDSPAVASTFSAASLTPNNNEVVLDPNALLHQYITGGAPLNREQAIEIFRQHMGTQTIEGAATDAAPADVQQLFADELARTDQAYNDQRTTMSSDARLKYVLPTLVAQLSLENSSFLAEYNPDTLIDHSDSAKAMRQMLDGQFPPELKDQIGAERYDVVLNLMATAQVQLLTDKQQQRIQHMVDAMNYTPHHDHNAQNNHGNHQDGQQNHHNGHHQSKPHHDNGNHHNGHEGHHHKPPHHPLHHVVHHEAGPNTAWLSADRARAIQAIFRHTQNAPHLRTAMIMGCWLESTCRPDARGAGSYGIFQEQNPGDPNGPHPGWSVGGALNPDQATKDMLPDYHGGLSQVSEALWASRPMEAAELAVYHAERPADLYHNTQGWDRVREAFGVAMRVQQHYQHDVNHHNQPHAHHTDHHVNSLAQQIEHYPGVHGIVSHTDTGVPLPGQLGNTVYYSQWDKRWAGDEYNTSSYSSEMRLSGCGPTSVAEVISTLGHRVYPHQMANWMQAHGYRVSGGTAHEGIVAAPEAFGLHASFINPDVGSVQRILKQGGRVIVNGTDSNLSTPATSSGHFYVIRGFEHGKFQVNDSNSITKSLTSFAPDQILGPASMAVGITR